MWVTRIRSLLSNRYPLSLACDSKCLIELVAPDLVADPSLLVLLDGELPVTPGFLLAVLARTWAGGDLDVYSC